MPISSARRAAGRSNDGVHWRRALVSCRRAQYSGRSSVTGRLPAGRRPCARAMAAVQSSAALDPQGPLGGVVVAQVAEQRA